MCFTNDLNESVTKKINLRTAGLVSTNRLMKRTSDRFIGRVRIVIPISRHVLDSENLASSKSPTGVVQLGCSAEGSIDVKDHEHGADISNKGC